MLLVSHFVSRDYSFFFLLIFSFLFSSQLIRSLDHSCIHSFTLKQKLNVELNLIQKERKRGWKESGTIKSQENINYTDMKRCT